ncbi:MAG: hypothetical protein KBG73_09235 [Candidatus Promineofilum sp.]|nr:hypothetical protein [Promineifilum sp.]
MPQLDTFGADYLRLTLEIDKHIEGYLDAYTGPAALRDEVRAAPLRPPADLLADVDRLEEHIPDADPARALYLAATLRAIECTVRMLGGEKFDYLEEAHRLYDIRPRLIPESRLQAAHEALDNLLPGQPGQNLAARLATWRQQFEIEAARGLELLELARDETRRRTAAFVALPDDESVEIRLTSGQPWSAYNWYLGGGRSLIEFNTDLPLNALALLSTFAHEGYPGHHTEGVLKEIELYQKRGYAEQAAMLLHSPAAVISEGIATIAREMIFPNDSHYAWNAEVLLPAAGLPVEPGLVDRLRRIDEATTSLRYVNGNAAILYHTGLITKAGAIDYMQTYALATPERAAKSVSFFTHPLFRAYIFTYSIGYDLIAATADPAATFRRLLTEQVLPSELALT